MIRPRRELLATPRTPHGGPAGRLDERMPLRLDFSVSLNAWGPAEVIREAVRSAPLDRYPDPESLAPRRAAAERWERPLEEIAFGAGAAELIQATCFAFLRPGDCALVPGPTFGEYARAAGLCGARVLHGTAPAPAFRLDLDAISAAVAEHRPRIAFLCAPNSPTGQPLEREAVRRLADACAAADTLLLLDQSYDAFLPRPVGTPALPGHGAVLHVRSITKDHALAGVRAAYAMGPAGVVDAIERARVPWAASTAAQAAAVASFSPAAADHLARTIPRLRFERELLEGSLSRLRLPVVRSATHFFLAEVGDAAATTARLRDEHGIGVRDCTSFGLPRHIRAAARRPEENLDLLRALEAVCST